MLLLIVKNFNIISISKKIALPVILLSHLYFKLFHDILSVQGDEAFSIFHSQKDLRSFIAFLVNDESPLTFYLLLGGWIHLFGIKLMAVKTLPVIFSVGSALLIFLFAKKRMGLLAAVMGSCLFLFSNLHFDFSHEIRAYSLVSLLTIASFYLFLELVDHPSSRSKLILYTLCTALLPYTHYNAVYVPLVQFLSLMLLYYKDMFKYKNIFFTYLIAFSLFLPQLYFLRNVMPSEDFWLDFPDFAMFEYVFMNLSGNVSWSTELYSLLLLLCLLAVSPWRKKIYLEDFNWKLLVILISWFILPVLVNYLVAQFTPIFRLRYVLYCSIGFLLSIAYLIAFLRIHLVLRVIIALAIISTYLTTFSPHDRNVEDWENVAEIIHKEKDENTAVVVSAAYMFVNFSYFYDQESFSDYENTIALLEEQNIYLVNSINQLTSNKKLDSFDRVLLILSHNQDVDPEGKIISYFLENDSMNYCEKYGSKIGAKVYEFAKNGTKCEKQLEFQSEVDSLLNCYEWKLSKYDNSGVRLENYSLTGEKDSNCVNHFDFKNEVIPIGPANPFSPTLKLASNGIEKLTVQARFKNTAYKDAKFVVAFERRGQPSLWYIKLNNLRRDEYLLQDVAINNGSEELLTQFSVNVKERYLKENFEIVIYLWNYGGENIYLKELKIGAVKSKRTSAT